jgi:hypothetical protein
MLVGNGLEHLSGEMTRATLEMDNFSLFIYKTVDPETPICHRSLHLTWALSNDLLDIMWMGVLLEVSQAHEIGKYHYKVQTTSRAIGSVLSLGPCMPVGGSLPVR